MSVKRIMITLLLLGGIAIASTGPKALYKVFRLNPQSVAISCASGQIPDISPKAGRVQDGIVIVSCSQ